MILSHRKGGYVTTKAISDSHTSYSLVAVYDGQIQCLKKTKRGRKITSSHGDELKSIERGEIVQEQISTAYLVVDQGSQAGKRIELWKEHTTIGRSRDCDIFLE